MKHLVIITLLFTIALNANAQKKVVDVVPIDVERFFSDIVKLELGTWKYKDETNRQYGLPESELIKTFNIDSKGTLVDEKGFNTDYKIALNFTAVWVMAKTIQNLIDENVVLKGEINSLNDNLMHIQSLHSEVITLMSEYSKISELENKIIELSTQIVDLQQEISTIKNQDSR